MRNTLIGIAATVLVAVGFCLPAVAQEIENQRSPLSPQTIKAMRNLADAYAKDFARFANDHAIKKGRFENIMTDYAKDFGGAIPINPCTETRTGYTMTVSVDGQSAAVAAITGWKCGKWNAKVYRMKL